jgi:NhaP-type Na+/H+ or K+/H+ antiporter
MDPYAHTFIALALLFTSHFLGKKIGRQEGISAAVTYMIEMGACTEEDLQRANEKFAEEEDDV